MCTSKIAVFASLYFCNAVVQSAAPCCPCKLPDHSLCFLRPCQHPVDCQPAAYALLDPRTPPIGCQPTALMPL